ncbi:MAG: RNA methyltransferase [Micrococcales bacterium]|nr:RNA methyltransferase [Micrococcales bacterium]
MTLDNLASDRIKKIRSLARASVRRQLGLLLVEGPQACREAAAKGLVKDLYLCELASDHYPELASLVDDAGGRVHLATRQYVDAISGAAQGVVAVARLAPPVVPTGWSKVAVFDQISDPGNAGSVLRSAAAMGFDGVFFTAGSVDPYSPKVIRTSAGMVFHVPTLAGWQMGPLNQVVEDLRSGGPVQVLATDAVGDLALGDLTADWLGDRVAWLFGNEASGLGQEGLALADHSVRIEMFGAAESLNLGAAASIVLHWASLMASKS